jgi:hypothetical protein
MGFRAWGSVATAISVALLTTVPAVAQLAPTGNNYPSDSIGFGGVTPSGGYSTSVPLDFPGVHGGLPVPLHVVYGGTSVGAAGVGWDIPLSYIRRDVTLTRHRPISIQDSFPRSQEYVSMVLDGRRLTLVRTGSTNWAALSDAPDIQATQQSDGSWLVFDGRGRTYKFVSSDNGNLWLLRQIRDSLNNRVNLVYTVGTETVAGVPALTVDLTNVNYNVRAGDDDSQYCAKAQINLAYARNEAAPMSFSMLDARVLVRMHKLQSINVSSVADCGDAARARVESLIRKYVFSYQPDVDTGQPRLQKVEIMGKEGTAEHTPITLAKYTYGTAKTAGQLQ